MTIFYEDKIIQHVTSTKFLGLHLDYQTNWKVHADDLCSRINKFVFALKQLSKMSSMKTVLTAYNGHIASIICYGIIFWGNSVNALQVFKAQKKCIRTIKCLKVTDSCKMYFVLLRILTVPSLYIPI
jgi:hypothetical protein